MEIRAGIFSTSITLCRLAILQSDVVRICAHDFKRHGDAFGTSENTCFCAFITLRSQFRLHHRSQRTLTEIVSKITPNLGLVLKALPEISELRSWVLMSSDEYVSRVFTAFLEAALSPEVSLTGGCHNCYQCLHNVRSRHRDRHSMNRVPFNYAGVRVYLRLPVFFCQRERERERSVEGVTEILAWEFQNKINTYVHMQALCYGVLMITVYSE